MTEILPPFPLQILKMPRCKEVEILGVTFKCDSKFSVHVKNKLIKANKSLYISLEHCAKRVTRPSQ